jgi:hypothetical protein
MPICQVLSFSILFNAYSRKLNCLQERGLARVGKLVVETTFCNPEMHHALGVFITGAGRNRKTLFISYSLQHRRLTMSSLQFPPSHGLLNYRHKNKMSSSKKWPVKGLCGRLLSFWYLSYTYMYLFTHVRGGGGEREPERRLEGGATDHKAGSKIPTCLNVSQSINSDNTCLMRLFKQQIISKMDLK